MKASAKMIVEFVGFATRTCEELRKERDEARGKVKDDLETQVHYRTEASQLRERKIAEEKRCDELKAEKEAQAETIANLRWDADKQRERIRELERKIATDPASVDAALLAHLLAEVRICLSAGGSMRKPTDAEAAAFERWDPRFAIGRQVQIAGESFVYRIEGREGATVKLNCGMGKRHVSLLTPVIVSADPAKAAGGTP